MSGMANPGVRQFRKTYAIRLMSRANPTWGAPRIHGELLKLGMNIGDQVLGPSPGPAMADLAEGERGAEAAATFIVAIGTQREPLLKRAAAVSAATDFRVLNGRE